MYHLLLVRSSLSSRELGTCFATPGSDGMCLKVFLNEQVHCKRSIRSKKEVQKAVVRSWSAAVLLLLPAGWRFTEASEMPPLRPVDNFCCRWNWLSQLQVKGSRGALCDNARKNLGNASLTVSEPCVHQRHLYHRSRGVFRNVCALGLVWI